MVDSKEMVVPRENKCHANKLGDSQCPIVTYIDGVNAITDWNKNTMHLSLEVDKVMASTKKRLAAKVGSVFLPNALKQGPCENAAENDCPYAKRFKEINNKILDDLERLGR